jgi:WhiB family transcriptional regulator, redox-sensing transcriptional regulator
VKLCMPDGLHDMDVTGRDTNGHCYECAVANWRENRMRVDAASLVCLYGHIFTVANTSIKESGARVCKACAVERVQAFRKGLDRKKASPDKVAAQLAVAQKMPADSLVPRQHSVEPPRKADPNADDWEYPERPRQGDWIDKAACAGLDVDAFYREYPGGVEIARKVCAVCPVQQDCLDYAIESGEEYGIWGGMNRAERNKVATRRLHLVS